MYSRKIIVKLKNNTGLMVLPESEFPPLAVELNKRHSV